MSVWQSATNSAKLALISAWQSSNSIKSIMMDFAPGSSSICFDAGASACISSNKNDFVSLVACKNSTIQGIGTGLAIAGKGTLQWCILTNEGQEVNPYVRNALYVPGIPMNLLCPQQIAQ